MGDELATIPAEQTQQPVGQNAGWTGRDTQQIQHLFKGLNLGEEGLPEAAGPVLAKCRLQSLVFVYPIAALNGRLIACGSLDG